MSFSPRERWALGFTLGGPRPDRLSQCFDHHDAAYCPRTISEPSLRTTDQEWNNKNFLRVSCTMRCIKSFFIG